LVSTTFWGLGGVFRPIADEFQAFDAMHAKRTENASNNEKSFALLDIINEANKLKNNTKIASPPAHRSFKKREQKLTSSALCMAIENAGNPSCDRARSILVPWRDVTVVAFPRDPPQRASGNGDTCYSESPVRRFALRVGLRGKGGTKAQWRLVRAYHWPYTTVYAVLKTVQDDLEGMLYVGRLAKTRTRNATVI
jgi:hypothetical protein